MTARDIASLVPMPGLLAALGFAVNERTRRGACLIHGGSNPTAFAWTEAGLWNCHSCGAGGDRIALVRAVRQCSFREAVEFLARLAGVEFRPTPISGQNLERLKAERERAERLAWHIRDEILKLRVYYLDCLHRTERLQKRIGQTIHDASTERQGDAVWNKLARLAAAATFYLAAYDFMKTADAEKLARFALASSAERRAVIRGDSSGNAKLHAA